MRRTLKFFSGLILSIAFLAAVVSLLVIIVSLLHCLHIDDVPESAALILASSVGVILVAGILLDSDRNLRGTHGSERTKARERVESDTFREMMHKTPEHLPCGLRMAICFAIPMANHTPTP
jgi:hypothetical protein